MIETRFPKFADAPPQFLIWEIDELVPVAFCFLLFLPTRNLLLGLIIGIGLMRLYRYCKQKYPEYFYIHFLWSWGIWQPKTKQIEIPYGYITKYRE